MGSSLVQVAYWPCFRAHLLEFLVNRIIIAKGTIPFLDLLIVDQTWDYRESWSGPMGAFINVLCMHNSLASISDDKLTCQESKTQLVPASAPFQWPTR